MLTYFLIVLSLLAAIILTLIHMPRWISRLVMRICPIWAQALLVHAFGYLVGGVTGHVVGAMASVPYYFLARFWLEPHLSRRIGRLPAETSRERMSGLNHRASFINRSVKQSIGAREQ